MLVADDRVLDQERKSARAIAAVALALRNELGSLILELGFTSEGIQGIEITADHKERARCLCNDAFCRETIESIMRDHGGLRPCDDVDCPTLAGLVCESTDKLLSGSMLSVVPAPSYLEIEDGY